MTSHLPTGTITFLFTDIEGSTPLWEAHPAAMQTSLARHDALLRHAVETNRGRILKTTGDGGLAACATVQNGLAAALASQLALAAQAWSEIKPDTLRVRRALHSGVAQLDPDACAAAWSAGRELTMEQAVAYALETKSSAQPA